MLGARAGIQRCNVTVLKAGEYECSVVPVTTVATSASTGTGSTPALSPVELRPNQAANK